MELSNSHTWTPPGADRLPVTFHFSEMGTLDALKYQAIFETVNPGTSLTPEQIETMITICIKYTTGWDNVTDKGEPVPCTSEAKERVFNMVRVFQGVLELAAAILPNLSIEDEEKKASAPGPASSSDSDGAASPAEKVETSAPAELLDAPT